MKTQPRESASSVMGCSSRDPTGCTPCSASWGGRAAMEPCTQPTPSALTQGFFTVEPPSPKPPRQGRRRS